VSLPKAKRYSKCLTFHNNQFTEATTQAIHAFATASSLRFLVLTFGCRPGQDEVQVPVTFDIRSPILKAYAQMWREKLENLRMIGNGFEALVWDSSGGWAVADDVQ
jgi:hypothetical protein